MSVKRRAVIEDAVGETRAAVYEHKKIVELYVRRRSDENKARAGDIFCGIVRKVDPSIGAAFLDLGAEPAGFLKFTMAPNAPRFREGQAVEVEVTREAEPGKGPVLRFVKLADKAKPGRISGDDLKDFLNRRFDNEIEFETARVGTIEDACQRELHIPGGGDIAIDFTRALVAIDVDKGPAQSGLSVGKAALELIASQLRLRGIGGLIVIDLPNLRQPKQREQLYDLAIELFSSDPNLIKIAPMSRFGVVEMTRSKPSASLDEILLDRFGIETDETLALRGLRRLETEARSHSGAQLTLHLPTGAKIWLDTAPYDWKSEMINRIGARYTVTEGHQIDVTSDR